MLQSIDALFVGGNHRRQFRVGDAVKELLNLAVEFRQFSLERSGTAFLCSHAMVPEFREHCCGNLEEVFRRAKLQQESLEFALQRLAADRLPIASAPLLRTEIVRVLTAHAFRPASGQRRPTIAARDEAPEREVFVQVFARGSLGVPVQALLNLAERLEANQRFMLSLSKGNTPVWRFHISCIDRARQNVFDALIGEYATLRRELRLRFEETPHFSLGLETTAGVAFERFLDYGGARFIADKRLALSALNLAVAIADRRGEWPETIHDAGAHAVNCLLTVLLALMLADAGEQVFNEHGVRILAELDGRRFQ